MIGTLTRRIPALPNFAAAAPGSTVLRLTALLLVFYPLNPATAVLRVAGGLMLAHKSFLTNSWLWFVTACAASYGIVTGWFRVDNHEFLIMYWCWACFLSVRAPDTEASLAWNARILLGLCFLLAVIWKLILNQYLDGSFLYFTLLTDDRFAKFAAAVAAVNPDLLTENRHILDALEPIAHEGLRVGLNGSLRLKGFALVLSYWTLAIEAAVGIAYLIPRIRMAHQYRTILLMIFVVTTYIVFPLHRFAMILCIMGFADCSDRTPWVRWAQFLLFFLVLFF
ncbi:MAG: hypothetical protein Q8R76_09140 [Candidatus Omnitrophota bacterium]|nr:hypothetical protein [Candidatus Omnitrophota bacterium]